MELYVPDSTVFIVKFWQKFMHQLVELVTSNNTEENVSLTEENVSLTEENVSLTEENVSLTDCSAKRG